MTKRDWLILAAIMAVAFAVRLVYVLQLRSSPLFAGPILDGQVHDQWARAILHGERFFEGAYFKAPLYPWVLSVIYAVSDGSYLAPRLVQAAMGAASCGLLYLVGRESFGRIVGAIAGFAAATFWILVFFDGELLLEPLSIFLNLLAMWLLLRASRRDGWVLWAVAGLVWGLSAINRPNVLAFMPVAAVWILLLHKGRWRAGLGRAVVFACACAAPIVPVTVRNYVVGDDFVLIASQAGPNLYIGNNPASDGMSARMLGARSTWTGGYEDWVAVAEQESGRPLKPSEVSRFFVGKTCQFMREKPLHAFNLMLVKLQLYFWEWEIGNNLEPQFHAARYTPIVGLLPLTTGAVLAFGLVGVLLTIRGGGRLFPLGSFMVIYSATVILFFVCSRFRMPVLPFFILFAAAVPVRLWAHVRRREWKAVAVVVLLAVLCWSAIHRGVPESMRQRAEATFLSCVGSAYGRQGRIEAARREYEAALRVDARCLEARKALGNMFLADGLHEKSVEQLRAVLEISPYEAVHVQLSQALAAQGLWKESIETLREGLKRSAGFVDVKRSLAHTLSTCPVAGFRDGREALKLAKDVVALQSQDADALDTLAAAYAEVGRFSDAVRTAREALRLAESKADVIAADRIRGHLSLFERGQRVREE